jgi:hypothetical protein
MALAVGFLVGGATAQIPPDDKDPVPPRSIQLTAEQDHVIKEIVLKDMHIEPVPRSAEIRIDEKVPRDIELRTFPPLVAEKASQNIQILYHRESDRSRISAEHNCGHNQVSNQRLQLISDVVQVLRVDLTS